MKLYDMVDPMLVAPTARAACQAWEDCNLLDLHEGGCAELGASGLVISLPDPEEAWQIEAGISDDELAGVGKINMALEEIENAKEILNSVIRELIRDQPDTRLAAYAEALDADANWAADNTPATRANGTYWARVLAEHEDR